MPLDDHDLRDGHIARRQSFRFGKSIYNALKNNKLSQFQPIFNMALSLYIILCSIIVATSANIRLERRQFCDYPIVHPALLSLDARAEAGLSKEKSDETIRRSSCLYAAAGRPTWSIVSLSCCSPSLASCWLSYSIVHIKWRIQNPPEANSFN